jgi:uncharacterized protein
MKELLLKDHSVALSALLHLLPGILAGAVFYIAAYFLRQYEKPLVFAYYITTILVLLPLMTGILIWLGNGSIGKQNPLSIKEHAFYIGISLVWAVMVFALAGSFLSPILLEKLFYYLPEWITGIQIVPDESTYSKMTIRLAWVLTLILTSILAPLAEELYFRGFLLPRIGHIGIWAPVLSSILFALYHFWSPWLFLVRAIAIFPMVYFSWKTGNIYIALWTHILLNFVGDSLLTFSKAWL